ncbi:MAG: MgtC/SapB family protein [Euryarchaeota archaeon]|nr:MgtC/SapB family protein [Euryarchaeota archaeon]MBV1730163.1 MgtC/SapB family protein [Methanobacterium sp.]MBU4548419.1 MgtC/SapB family protein [Euryarchaeota archaeon]MBU4607459.1 MgtC/SapB family protein [Euryarchaeota archaeon]MBV1754094.1 MgtC/SapB family protein [Methanobacterium sp.]
MDALLFIKFITALAIGALIGIERERKSTKTEFAGVRTFILIALWGILSAYLSESFPYFILVAFMALSVLIGLGYWLTVKDTKDLGLTTEVAALLTFILGALCYYEEGYTLSVVLAIVVTTLLALKPVLHKLAQKISEKEMIDTLKFLIIAFVILPLLPNETLGPWDVFNPYQAWLMAVFISGISYAGYIAMRFLGPQRGLGITGIIGGLVSSTAVVTAMAARVKESPYLLRAGVFATVVASSMMFLRVFFEVLVINPALAPSLAAPMIIMGVLGILLGWLVWRRSTVKGIDSKIKLDNPFTLKPALIFGALFIAILFLSKIANIYLGSRGVYLASIISGVADVDAITISMAFLARSSTLSSDTAVTAITLATISNTAVKFAIALLLGTRHFARNVGILFAVIVTAGIAAVILI